MTEQQMDTLNDDEDEAISVLMLTGAISGIIDDGDGSSEGRLYPGRRKVGELLGAQIESATHVVVIRVGVTSWCCRLVHDVCRCESATFAGFAVHMVDEFTVK